MAFREVSVTQIREVLRRWLRDEEGLRIIGPPPVSIARRHVATWMRRWPSGSIAVAVRTSSPTS